MAIFEKKPPPAPLTPAQAVARHQKLAEEHLVSAAKAGRLEAETRHATMATAHAVLALLGHLQQRGTGL